MKRVLATHFLMVNRNVASSYCMARPPLKLNILMNLEQIVIAFLLFDISILFTNTSNTRKLQFSLEKFKRRLILKKTR